MAAANVATLLARDPANATSAGDGEPVLMIDWSLEAPSLHHFFALDDPATDDKPGLIDLFTDIEGLIGDQVIPEADGLALLDSLDLDKYVVPAVQPNLFLLKAGRFDGNYFPVVNGFGWQTIDQKAPWLFQALAERWRSRYRFVVIDSRAGVNDMSGLCTMMLPDTLVAMFTANRASIEGASDIVRFAAEYRGERPGALALRVCPVPSRIEFTEGALRDYWRGGSGGFGGFQPEFEGLLAEMSGSSEVNLDQYFSEVQIPYVPRFSYGERVAVLIEEGNHPSAMYRAYRALAARIATGVQPWEQRVAPTVDLVAAKASLVLEGQSYIAAGETHKAVRAMFQVAELEERDGQANEARRKYLDAAMLARNLGDPRLLALTLDRAGRLETRAGDWPSAHGHLTEAAAYYHEADEQWKRANTLEILAGASTKLGKTDEAALQLAEALRAYQQAGDPLGAAFTHQELGDLARAGSNGSPETHYLQAIDIYREERETQGLAACLRSLAEVQRKRNRIEEAKRHFSQAVELSRGEADPAGLTSAMAGLADMERRLKEYTSADAHYAEAIALARQAGLITILAGALQGLADMQGRQGKLADAESNYVEAIDLFKQAGNALGMANAVRSLGDLERRLGRLANARARYEQAMELYQGEHHALGQANSLQSLGDLAKREEHWEDAQVRYQHAIQMFKKANAPLGLANALKSLGDVESECANDRLAADHYQEAIELYRLERNGLGQANALQGLGDLHRKQLRYSHATEVYVMARDLYRAENSPMGLAYTCAELARVSHVVFDFGASIKFMEEATTAAEASRVPSVSHYVWNVQREIRGIAIPA